MLNILTSGLPVSAQEILVNAALQIFGKDGAEVVILDKQNLRSRVRMSQRNATDVLVVLDEVSHKYCEDIENGLYKSDKYCKYSTDESLVSFLNEHYGLSITVQVEEPMEVVPEVNTESDELIERLRVQLGDRDSIIDNLNARIRELQAVIDGDSVSTGSLTEDSSEDLENEIIDLRNQILDLTSESKEAEEKLQALQKSKDAIESELRDLKISHNSLLSDYKSASDELTDYRVKYSTQCGVLRDKDSEIASLKSMSEESKGLSDRIKTLEEEKRGIEKQLSDAAIEISQLRVDIASKDAELTRLRESITAQGETSEQLQTVESELKAAREEISRLEKELIESQGKVSSTEGDYALSLQSNEVLNSTIQEKDAQIESLRDRLKDSEDTLVTANTELIRVRSEVEMLKKSTSRDTDIESMYRDMSALQTRYDSLATSIFGRIYNCIGPKTNFSVNLLRDIETYQHIRFVFSGSTESRKGTYKALLDEFRQLPSNEKVVIVDVTSETCVDYVFEINKVESGLSWFSKGGGIQPYLSQTCLSNVKVLSPGLSYINDGYFLTVDWNKRLRELDNSGYNVVLYCGDISTMVGRIFHESFAGCGTSMIYTHGNAVGARTIVSNLRGLSNASESIVCYFEFNRKVDRFYRMVADKNECRVISMI